MRLLTSLAVLLNVSWALAQEPLVPRLREQVQPAIDKHLVEAQQKTFAKLAEADTVQALFKPPLRQRAVRDPWGALTELERRGLSLAEGSRGGLGRLPELVNRMNAFLDKPASRGVMVARDPLASLDDHLRYITAVLDAADKLCEEALVKLSEDERAFLFARPAQLIHHFGPQEQLDDKTRPMLRDDRTFCTDWEQRIDGVKFMASVQTLLQLTNPEYLEALRRAMAIAPVSGQSVPGITGDLLAVRETRHGLLVLAGGGRNTFELNRPVAFLADIGGDDTYRGVIASSFDAKHPFGVVVDFAGKDTYQSAELGLATGRLGCGCLIDRSGDDVYQMAPGSGGCGFAGVGFLVDEAGKDSYTGTRFTQGAALCGLGLLLDLAGDDTYTSHGYSLGLGGPLGVGAVVDVAGNDRYVCGKHYGSGYNADDAPSAKPGDPNYQYDAFGAGMGIGRRLYPASPEGDTYHLAGGVGVWLDLAGDDRSETSNFSQACAYFFGIGLKLDFAGNDHHAAARYGYAAGAHYGLGLFIDYEGDDTYAALGPVYDIGGAWDRSVFLLIDGRGNDTYDLTHSSGGGRGDYGGWGIFADLEGKDKYRVNGLPGGASDAGLGVFFDGGGEDEYPKAGPAGIPANRKTKPDGKGYLFVDR